MDYLPENLYTSQDSFLVVLNSKNATQFFNGTKKSYVRFDFEQSLNLNAKAIKSTCSVIQFNSPNSLYNINETNCYLNMTLNDLIEVELTVPYGNYNAVSFAKYFNTQLAAKGLSISLDTTTNRFKITHTTYDLFTINESSTAFNVMGFAKNTLYTSSNKILSLPYTCNFNGYLNFNIHIPNLGTQNMDSLNGSSSSIVQTIPIDPTNSIISFAREYEFSFRIYADTIDFLEIALMDESENYIDLNNQDWNLVLCFSSFSDLNRFHYKQNFHSVLQNAYL